MTDFVLDASVAAKWFLPVDEPLTFEALALYQKFAQREVLFIVPDLFWAELASAFWKAIRAGRFSVPSAEEAISLMKQRNLPTHAAASLLNRAFQIATVYGRSVYDSLYVALAVQTKLQFVTADERLANALAVYFPVKWLGGI